MSRRKKKIIAKKAINKIMIDILIIKANTMIEIFKHKYMSTKRSNLFSGEVVKPSERNENIIPDGIIPHDLVMNLSSNKVIKTNFGGDNDKHN